MLALGARGALSGAVGGAAAGALDFVLALGRVGGTLPVGRWKLLLFLVAEYGAAAGLLGLGLGLIAGALGWATDLGPLWRVAFGRGVQPGRAGARVIAYLLATTVAALALGWATRAVALGALARFHHRGLTAALVGGSTAALGILGAVLALLLASALSPLLRLGPRLRLRLGAPAGLMAPLWMLGLLGGAGGVAVLLFTLEQRVRMPPALKALNTGLWAPPLLLGAIGLAHLAARLLAPRLPPALRRGLSRPDAAALATVLALVLPLAAAALRWPIVRQLDLRPFIALGIGAMVALATALRSPTLAPPAPRAMAVGLVLLPVLLVAATLDLGRSDRVRKAAIAHTGVTGPVVRVLHAISDLDRDGHAALLGGGDCDDLDREIHPGAFDWPDDGIDQNCNGHQASLAPPTPRRYAQVPDGVPERPNVLLITIDALRADHVGSYGYPRPTTPRLDALAREAVRFDQGWAHAPSTRYSVPAILSGRYPSTIAVGSAWWPPNVLPENRLLGEILKDLGYRTAAFLPYYYFDRRWGLDQGFDDYDTSLQSLHSMGGDPAATRGSSARQLADRSVSYIEAHKEERFFLWAHFYDTHFRFERHPDAPETDFGSDELALYDGEIRYTDLHVGRVLDALRGAGLWDRTIVIVTADHGEGFGEHGIPPNQRHGYHLYRTETQVPFLIRVPGLAPRVVRAPVGHVDLVPTLLNTLRRPPGEEPQLLGDSVLSAMLGDEAPRAVFQEVWFEGPTSRKAVVHRDWHLIRNLIPDDTTELYQLREDPSEDLDRAGLGEPSEDALAAQLAEWMDRIALPADFRRRVEGNVSTSPLPFSRPLGDVLGGALVVEGIDVKTPAARVGEPVELALVLHAREALPEGWHLFTHLVGPSGRRLNADHEPLEGLYPLARLKRGTWLRDRVRVVLPTDWPPGPLRVEVGLWRRGERAPIEGPHGRADRALVAATLEVSP